jgi:cytidylate kinase
LVITIDGPVAAGKTTAAHRLANHLDITLLDTGAIYRTVAWLARQADRDWHREEAVEPLARRLSIEFRLRDGINRVFVEDRDLTDAIRQPEISHGASVVSAHPRVRAALLELQRAYGACQDVIAEGRDTGTVVFPAAEFKFFLTAAPEVRAQRRCLELRARGVDAELAAVLEELQRRDQRDSNREVAPLLAAPEAVRIDSSSLSVDEVVDTILSHLPTENRN